MIKSSMFFRKVLFGYDKTQVEELLEEKNKREKEMYEKILSLQEKIEQNEREKNQVYEVIEEAKKNADKIVNQAETKAKNIIDDAETKFEATMSKVNRMSEDRIYQTNKLIENKVKVAENNILNSFYEAEGKLKKLNNDTKNLILKESYLKEEINTIINSYKREVDSIQLPDLPTFYDEINQQINESVRGLKDIKEMFTDVKDEYVNTRQPKNNHLVQDIAEKKYKKQDIDEDDLPILDLESF